MECSSFLPEIDPVMKPCFLSCLPFLLMSLAFAINVSIPVPLSPGRLTRLNHVYVRYAGRWTETSYYILIVIPRKMNAIVDYAFYYTAVGTK